VKSRSVARDFSQLSFLKCSNDYVVTHLSTNDWNKWGRPLNVESRGQGFQSKYFYIYEFVGEDQDAAAAREEGDKE
jgi:hypothetical protein